MSLRAIMCVFIPCLSESCGTDLHIAHGTMDARVSPGTVIGHEMCGRVDALGDGVTDLSIDDLVVVRPTVSCGECSTCSRGDRHICPSLTFLGIDADGALQGSWCVPRELVHIATGISPQSAVLTEPLAVAMHDVGRSGLGAGDRALVIGGGPIGLLIALVAQGRGAAVTLSETKVQRADFARSLGIRVVEDIDGVEFDIVFEVTGSAPGFASAMAAARPRGTVVLVGIQTRQEPQSLFPVFWKELTVLGARLYTPSDFEAALLCLREQSIPADRLLTGTFPLQELTSAISELESGDQMKIAIEMSARDD